MSSQYSSVSSKYLGIYQKQKTLSSHIVSPIREEKKSHFIQQVRKEINNVEEEGKGKPGNLAYHSQF